MYLSEYLFSGLLQGQESQENTKKKAKFENTKNVSVRIYEIL